MTAKSTPAEGMMDVEAVLLTEDEVVELGEEFGRLSKFDQSLLFQRTLWTMAMGRRFMMAAEVNASNPMIIGGDDVGR